MLWVLLVVPLLLLPGAGLAQLGQPNSHTQSSGSPFGSRPDRLNNPHPMQPNAAPLSVNTSFGTPIASHYVAPRQLQINVYVPMPGSLPGEYRPTAVEIPGYYVTETTTGYVYPERWTIDQLNVGVYQWRMLPTEFRRK